MIEQGRDVTVKQRVYEILEVARPGDRTSQLVDGFLMGLILANVGAAILQTVDVFYQRYGLYFDSFEIVSVLVFTLEYAARLWVCQPNPRYREPLRGRLRFATTPLALIDLIAIAPFWLTLGATDLRMVRILRLVRVLRLAKLARYSHALQTLGRATLRKRGELTVTLIALGVLWIFSASLMYVAEHRAQPEAFSSIPVAMWWAVATLTTVGYGDVYPVTAVGRAMGSVVAILGIGMFALPAGILGAAFLEEVEDAKNARGQDQRCPHCGEVLGPEDR